MLKYGIVSYDKIQINKDGNDYINLGDWIQSIAIETLYKEWGINDYIYVNRDDARYYDGDYVVLPFNGYNTFSQKYHYYEDAFPLSPKIIPVFFSMQLQDQYIPVNIRQQFLSYGPIGCRDEDTLHTMRKHGIPSYLSGCVTALLPRRKENKNKQTKVLIIDAPENIKDFMPSHLKNNIEYLTHIYEIHRTTGSNFTTTEESSAIYNRAKSLLDYYRDNAALVITRRLHVASPCMAMGIPVILARDDSFDGRYSWIDKFLPLYEKEDFNNIDWNPCPVNYEGTKKTVKNVLKQQLQKAYKNNREIYELSSFWENRQKNTYNLIIQKAIKKLDISQYKKYAIWGVVENSHTLKKLLSELYPDMQLVAAYDANMNGYFEGIKICNPTNISSDEILYFVVARGAFPSAKKLLTDLHNHYILAEFRSENWENNI